MTNLATQIKTVYTKPDEVMAIQVTPENQIEIAKWLQCANVHVEHDLEHNMVHIHYIMKGQTDLYVEDGWWIVLRPLQADGVKTHIQRFYGYSPEQYEENFSEEMWWAGA